MPIGARDLKAQYSSAAAVQALRVIEPDSQRPPFPSGLPIERAIERKRRLSVSQGTSSQGKPCAHRLLIRRMHIIALSDVQGDCHAGIDYVEGTALAIANQAPIFFRGLEARDLNKQERQVALLPLSSPIGDERGQQFRVQSTRSGALSVSP